MSRVLVCFYSKALLSLAGLCLSASASFAQPPQGTVTITKLVYTGSPTFGSAGVDDVVGVESRATFKKNDGSNASGYLIISTAFRYKYFDSNGNNMTDPDVLSASISSVSGNAVGAITLTPTFNYGGYNKVVAEKPQGAASSVRYYRITAGAGSQEAGNASANAGPVDSAASTVTF